MVYAKHNTHRQTTIKHNFIMIIMILQIIIVICMAHSVQSVYYVVCGLTCRPNDFPSWVFCSSEAMLNVHSIGT